MGTIRKESLYSLKSNEKLFNKFMDLKHSIQHIAGIVQNDMEIKGKEIEGWVKAYHIVQDGLKEVFEETQMYLATNLVEVDIVPNLGEKDDTLLYDFVWEDSEGEIHREKTTVTEWETKWFPMSEQNDDQITILKWPKFPAKE